MFEPHEDDFFFFFLPSRAFNLQFIIEIQRVREKKKFYLLLNDYNYVWKYRMFMK